MTGLPKAAITLRIVWHRILLEILHNRDPSGVLMGELASSQKSADQQGSRRRVAIIGSGPGGLLAARFLKQHGFEPVIFEQDDEIGGQWNVRSSHSGIWPSMVTNTSRLLTCFSDLAPEPEIPIFPSNQEVLAYLKRYARRFDLLSHVRYGTRIELVERNPPGSGWLIRSNGTEKKSEVFRMSLSRQAASTNL
jgi:cation diffusion facilitator CzcD-associated flavoprotein CzcO